MTNPAEQSAIVVELPGARAAFTTRLGGVSTGPYESLNLGILTDDDRESVRQNRELVQGRFGVRFAYGLQVHGSTVRVTDAPTGPPVAGALVEGDAIVTAARGVAPMVLAADCLPIAIVATATDTGSATATEMGPDGGAVAIVHAGWQGLARGVIAAAVARLRSLAAPGAGLAAAIGPGAGPCCYEVGEELHAIFAGDEQDFRRGRNLDLKAIARAQLRDAGVAAVDDLGICTICDPQRRFFSHRRDHGVTGRQGGLVWLT